MGSLMCDERSSTATASYEVVLRQRFLAIEPWTVTHLEDE
jgi:hypothetical protein